MYVKADLSLLPVECESKLRWMKSLIPASFLAIKLFLVSHGKGNIFFLSV